VVLAVLLLVVPVAGLQEGSFGVLAITGRGKFSRGVAGGLRVFTLGDDCGGLRLEGY
jgi:hypothetical protein